MNRRKAVQMAALASLAATGVLPSGQYAEDTKEDVKLEGGWQFKDLTYEKHIPEVEVVREKDIAAISVHVKHPQTAEHHISTFKLYDENRIEITECNLHSEMSQPRATFYLKLPEGTKLIAISDCNIHGIWMKKFEV